MAVAVVARAVPVSRRAPRMRDFHCSGCGRRLFSYTPTEITPAFLTVWKCRDCKTPNELRGADVIALLGALSRGEEMKR